MDYEAFRTAWTEAWEAPNSPGTLPMPLQFILNSYANRKMGGKAPRELVGMPVGHGGGDAGGL